jgi:peptide/nickel transport system ATP-binding protein
LFPLLDIRNLQIDFVNEAGTFTAVKNINIKVHRGEIVGIAGESGSGKSVTSMAILQLLNPSARYVNGEILFSEHGTEQIDLLKHSRNGLHEIRGKKISMIFQEPMTSLNPVFTCGEQVAEAIRLHENVSSAQARQRALVLFEKVRLPDPSGVYDRYPHQLSGGQKQRVMIAMAMSCGPSLLICDEPTTALDVTVQKSVIELIRELQRESSMGVIFITHDLAVIAEIATTAVIMYKGGVVEQGSVDQVFSMPSHPYTKALLACRPSLYKKGTRLPVVEDFIKHTNETGDGSEAKTPASARENSPVERADQHKVLLRAEHITVTFPLKKSLFGRVKEDFRAVDDVSFDVFEGETLGLVGESGCGKTTLGRALLRLLEPAAGKIIYQGTDLRSLNPSQLRRFRRNTQVIFQDPYSSLNPSIIVGAAISEPMAVHFPGMTRLERLKKTEDLLEKVGLAASAYHRYPHEFSGGQRQRIVIARALAVEPAFIVCDESVSALDVSVQAQVLNLLNDLKKDFGFTSIFITHDLSVVRYVSDRILVMKKGRIEEAGTVEQVFSRPVSPYTRALIDAIPSFRP